MKELLISFSFLFFFLLYTVIEMFELSEGRNPGDTSTGDLPVVLKLRKELCEAQVTWFFLFNSSVPLPSR